MKQDKELNEELKQEMSSFAENLKCKLPRHCPRMHTNKQNYIACSKA